MASGRRPFIWWMGPAANPFGERFDCAQVGVGLLPEGQGVQFVLLEAISFSSLLGRIPGAVGWARGESKRNNPYPAQDQSHAMQWANVYRFLVCLFVE